MRHYKSSSFFTSSIIPLHFIYVSFPHISFLIEENIILLLSTIWPSYNYFKTKPSFWICSKYFYVLIRDLFAYLNLGDSFISVNYFVRIYMLLKYVYYFFRVSSSRENQRDWGLAYWTSSPKNRRNWWLAWGRWVYLFIELFKQSQCLQINSCKLKHFQHSFESRYVFIALTTLYL